MNGKQEARSLVGVAVEKFTKAAQAQAKADRLTADLKNWTRNLNAVEIEEYNVQVEAYRREQAAKVEE